MTGKLVVCVVCSVMAVVAARVAVGEESHDLALSHFDRGRELEGEGDFAGALVEYERAMRLRPSFRLHRHLGRACAAVGRYTDALHHYAELLAQGGDELAEDSRREALELMADLRERVATIAIDGPEGASVHIDGIEVGTIPFAEPLTVDPGPHRVAVRLDDRGLMDEEVLLATSEERRLTARSETGGASEPDQTAVPARERPRLAPVWFWSTLAVTAALAAGWAVFGALALAEQAAYDDLNRPQRTLAEDRQMTDGEDRARAYGLTADVLLLTGAAAAVATVVMGLLTDFGGESEGSRASLGTLLSPWCTGLGISGQL